MALTDCPDCGRKVSNQSVACPRCGCPVVEVLVGHNQKGSTTPGNWKEHQATVTRSWLRPIAFVDWVFRWLVFWLRASAITQFLQLAASLSIAFGVAQYCWEADDRRRDAIVRAWNVIDEAEGDAVNPARDQMLEVMAKQGGSLARIKLSGAYIPGIALDGADLRNAKLDGTNLRSATLNGANLSGADLRRADLREISAGGATLIGANLRGADLIYARMWGADMTNAALDSVHLTYASNANFTGASLRGARLSSAILEHADFTGADLRGADLSWAYLGKAVLTNANLQDADLSMADLHGALLTSANLQRSNLSRVLLRDADLSFGKVQGAVLSGADLRRTRLEYVEGWESIFGMVHANIWGVRDAPTGLRDWALRSARALEIQSDSAWDHLDTRHQTKTMPKSRRPPLILEKLPTERGKDSVSQEVQEWQRQVKPLNAKQ